jgi:hypothetical protein
MGVIHYEINLKSNSKFKIKKIFLLQLYAIIDIHCPILPFHYPLKKYQLHESV